jgi:hypothetical protein
VPTPARGLTNPHFKNADAKAELIRQLRTPPISIDSLPPDVGPEREAAYAKKRAVDELIARTASTLASYGPEIVDQLLPLIRTPGDPGSEQYLKVWDYLGADAIPKFQTLLNDPDVRIRDNANKQLGRLAANSPAALQIQIARLSSEQAADRRSAIESSSAIRGPAAKQLRPSLMTSLNDESIPLTVRLRALSSALKSDRKATQSDPAVQAVLPKIIAASKSGEYLDRCAALTTLAELGTAARSALPSLQEQSSVSLPVISQEARSWMGGPISETAEKELKNRSQADMLRRLAREAIQAIEKESKSTE